MKRVFKFVAIACGVLLIIFAIPFFYYDIEYRIQFNRLKPPENVIDISSCLAWLKEPESAYRVRIDGAVFYQITGPYVSDLPSGRSAYTFDAQGKFIGWTPDEGDIHIPEQVFKTNCLVEKISFDELRQISKH